MSAEGQAKQGLLDSLMPVDPLMQIAWIDCLQWAIGNPGLVEQFREETGCKWAPGRTPIDRMVDEATGVEREFVLTFVGWFNLKVWGDVTLDSQGAQISDPTTETGPR